MHTHLHTYTHIYRNTHTYTQIQTHRRTHKRPAHAFTNNHIHVLTPASWTCHACLHQMGMGWTILLYCLFLRMQRHVFTWRVYNILSVCSIPHSSGREFAWLAVFPSVNKLFEIIIVLYCPDGRTVTIISTRLQGFNFGPVNGEICRPTTT